MAATLLTPASRGSSEKEAYLISLRFSIPTVLASTASPYYEVLAPTYGKIVRFKAYPAGTSTDFDLEVGDVDEFTSKSRDTILRVEEITATGVDLTGTDYYYVNQSAAEEGSFFVKVTNNDVANATGVISVEVVVSRY